MKHLVLDIGNVLCKVDQDTFINKLSAKTNMNVEKAARIMKRFWQLHDIGYTTIENELIDKFGIQSEVTLADLLNDWNHVVIADPIAIGIIKELINNYSVKIAFLSNMGVEHMNLMPNILHPIYDEAKKHFSCEVGARKPSKLFYQSFLMQHPEFEGAVYIDDLLENLAAGNSFGFKKFHFDSSKDTYDKLSAVVSLFST